MGGNAKYQTNNRFHTAVIRNRDNGIGIQAMRDENGNLIRIPEGDRVVGRNQRRHGLNSKTGPYQIDRHRINGVLSRNFTDDGQKITEALSKDDRLDFVQKYRKTMKEEPKITSIVKGVADELGLPLLGEATRRKKAKSAIRKRNDRALKGEDPELNDMVRFTHQVGEGNFGDDVNKAIASYEKKGNKVQWINNTWRDPTKAYKGVNVTFRSKNGTLFEVQFHTQQSHYLKEKQLHPIFEKQRKYPKTSSKYKEYENEMLELSKKITVPNGVSKIRIY